MSIRNACIAFLSVILLSGCASGFHGEAQADHRGGRAKADVFKMPFP